MADGGSSDHIVTLAKTLSAKIVQTDKKGKAVQMNAAAKCATGQIVFFVHADLQFPEYTFSSIANAIKGGYGGGGFTNIFDTNNDIIKRSRRLLNFRFFDNRE